MADRAPQRIVRRLEVGRPAPLDEQLWPVNVAVLLLAAFVEGVVIARLDFVDPRPLHNGWTWTATLLFSVGIGVWFVQRLDNRHVRRSVQLATVLSLLFHAVLVVMLNNDLVVAARTDPKKPPEDIAETQTYDVPISAPDALQPDYELPVETQTPDAVEPELSRIEPPVEPPPTADPTPPAPMPEEVVTPNVPQLNRLDETTPQRSETQGQASRSAAPSPGDSRTQANAPRVNSSARSRAGEVDSAAAPNRRETAGPQASQRATAAPTTADAQRPALPSRTPQRTDDLAQSSSTATLPRRVADPARTPTTALPPSDVAGTPRRTEPNAVDPRITAERRDTAGPRVDRSAQALSPQPSEVVRAPDAPQQPRSDNIVAAQPNRPANPASRARPSPNPSATSAAGTARAPNTPIASSAGVAPSLEPRAPSAQRSTASSPGGSPGAPGRSTGAPNATASVTPSPSANAGSRAERGFSPGAPGAMAQNPNNRRAAVASRAADGLGSAAAADRPQLAKSTGSGSGPSPSPGNFAERRSTGGIAGQGQSSNLDGGPLDAGPSALQNPGQIAGGSAVRPSATEAADNGSAFSLSRPAPSGKRRSNTSLPSSTLQAQSTPRVTGGGATAGGGNGAAPSLAGADSSIATERGSTNAPQSQAIAGHGGAAVDVGPQTALGEGGNGRPAGGGQASVGDIARSNTPTRRTPGGNSSTLGDAASPAVIANAPRGTGGMGGTGGSGATGNSTGTAEPQPGALAEQRTQSSPGGASGGVFGGTTGGDAPTGALAGGAANGPGVSGRPSGAGEESLATTSGVVRDGRRAAAGGVPEIGPATAPQLAGGTSKSAGDPGSPSSSGAPDGAPLDQQGPADARSAAGLAGRSTVGPSGSDAGPPLADAVGLGRPDDVSGRRDSLGGVDPGAALVTAGGGSGRRTNTAALPGGIGAAEGPALAGEGAATSEPGELSDGTLVGEPSRRDGGPESFVRTEAGADGPGGLGTLPGPEAGIAERRVRTDAPDIALEGTLQPQHQPLRQSVGLPTIDGQVRMAIDSYRLRRARRYRDAEVTGAGQPSAKTENSVETGLEFLARSQSPDGSWSLHDYRGKPAAEKCRIQSNTAATGLALLAYFGAGYDHYGDKYQDIVRGGLEWLINHQSESGDLYLAQESYSNQSARLYSHAIATIALCEAYGMTGDPRLKEPAQRAINFIVRSQHREFGGWRYSAVPGAETHDSDTSVSGWMVMALRSAELAKLNVPRETFVRVEGWLDRATAPGSRGAKYVYYPKGQDPRNREYGRGESPQMTSIGLLMRMYLGWDRTKPEMVRGADYLAETLPTAVTNAPEAWQGAYYWYYATQVMFHMRGEHWQKWNERLHPLLTQSQRNEGPLSGSWDPDGPASDMWGQFGGRIYVTTLNLLSLEVYYRHLPIYEDTAR